MRLILGGLTPPAPCARFRYLESLGVSSFYLSSFASFSGARFVDSLTDTDLEHYYALQLANGYHLPPGWLSAPAMTEAPLASNTAV